MHCYEWFVSAVLLLFIYIYIYSIFFIWCIMFPKTDFYLNLNILQCPTWFTIVLKERGIHVWTLWQVLIISWMSLYIHNQYYFWNLVYHNWEFSSWFYTRITENRAFLKFIWDSLVFLHSVNIFIFVSININVLPMLK